jgi:small GTP-binding protein
MKEGNVRSPQRGRATIQRPFRAGTTSSQGLTLRCTLRSTPNELGYFVAAAWGPDGRRLASAHEQSIRLWDAGTGVGLRPIRVPASDTISSLAWGSRDLIAIGLFDGTVLIINPSTGLRTHVLDGHFDTVNVLEWSPDGALLASGSNDGSIRIWDCRNSKKQTVLGEHAGPVRSIAWSPDAHRVASGGDDCYIRLWDPKLAKESVGIQVPGSVSSLAWSLHSNLVATGSTDGTIGFIDPKQLQPPKTLEGHTDTVTNLSFSPAGNLLASLSLDGTVRLWSHREERMWAEVERIQIETMSEWSRCLQFHPASPVLSLPGDSAAELQIMEIDDVVLAAATPVARIVQDTSAKVVLVGESNVGKSSLAMRLSEGRYPDPSEQGTTHGLRLWQVDSTLLDPSAELPSGHRHRIFLWDMGGQDEYRLVHQLFLHDATLALVFLDPSRGRTAHEEVEAWNRRLEKQLRGRTSVKLLVGAKVDQPSSIIDPGRLKQLIKRCGFTGYYETSALTGRGVDQLSQAINRHLDWKSLASTSRPELFQYIRDEIERRRKHGELVVLLQDLERVIQNAYPRIFEPGAVAAVAEQLGRQGLVVDTRLASGVRVLVLRIEEIETYAGSLIIMARNNVRGVPAIEERDLASPGITLPGLINRLPRYQEIIVLECVTELLIEHGICFRHDGLLIFPSLFPFLESDETERLQHSVSLYYDFTGAIDNIYASLIARLVVAADFGTHRLWSGRAEFDLPRKGLCGIREVQRKSGFAHIDIYFAESTDQERRDLFVRFVEDHLRRNGVEVHEHKAIKCRNCEYLVVEELVEANVARGEKDVICPRCRTRTLISDGVDGIRKRDRGSDQRIHALRSATTRRVREHVEEAKKAVSASSARLNQRSSEPIRILHLSDLHFTAATKPIAQAKWLLDDIRRKRGGLGIDSLEYLVISGDVTDKGNAEGFANAHEFVSLLIRNFGLSAERCILVPGNHDVQRLQSSYDWAPSVDGKAPGTWIKKDDIFLIRNDEHHPLRLREFSDAFFHKILQQPYPLEYDKQGLSYFFPETGIQFLTLNSAYNIDQFISHSTGVYPPAVAYCLRAADDQVSEARIQGHWDDRSPVLRIAVWHHAVTGQHLMQDTTFLEHLQKNDVKLCLHGDVHEMRRDCISYWHKDRRMQILGAGSFGAPAQGRPDSVPRLYNLLEVSKDLALIRVHTRCQMRSDGTWQGWNEWPRSDGLDGGVAYFDLHLTEMIE